MKAKHSWVHRAALVLLWGCVAGRDQHAIDAAPKSDDLRTVRFDGVGPIRVGMSVAEASHAAGLQLKEEVPDASVERCKYVLSPELSGIAFMVFDEKIARVDVIDATYPTAAGARVGMSEAELIRLYPTIRRTANTYDDAGHDLRVASRDGRFALIFVTDGKTVTSYRSGLREPVGWIEGCY